MTSNIKNNTVCEKTLPEDCTHWPCFSTKDNRKRCMHINPIKLRVCEACHTERNVGTLAVALFWVVGGELVEKNDEGKEIWNGRPKMIVSIDVVDKRESLVKTHMEKFLGSSWIASMK
ncbi:hypothetical protein ACHAPI_011050 [Fusarium lateritium]